MHRIARKKWISTVAAGAMLSAQLAMPLYAAAQDINNDAAFRLNKENTSGPVLIPPPGARLIDPLDRSDSTKTPIKHVILIIARTAPLITSLPPTRRQREPSRTCCQRRSSRPMAVSAQTPEPLPNGRLATPPPTPITQARPRRILNCPRSTPTEHPQRRIFPAPRQLKQLNRRCRSRTTASWPMAEPD